MSEVILTKDNFQAEVLQSDKPVMVDFYADWCGPCIAMAPIIEELSNERKDVKIARLDVDAEQDISAEYSVMSIPTFIVFKGGKEVARKMGNIGKTGIETLLKS